MNDPIISKHGGDDDPEIAEAIPIHQRGNIIAWRKRVVVGWNHQTDTPNGRRGGKIWAWVSEGGYSFQVYDENFNRSEKPGVVRFCGVANFTMVRMFHPYWTRNGQPPRDMRSADKRWCREQYNRLMRRDEARQRRDRGEDSDDSDDDDRRKRRRAPRRSTGRKAATAKSRRTEAKSKSKAKEREISISSSENEVYAFPDSETDSDTSDQPLIFAKKRQQNRRRDLSSDDSEDDTPKKRQRRRADSSDDEADRRSEKSQKRYAESGSSSYDSDDAPNAGVRPHSREMRNDVQNLARDRSANNTGRAQTRERLFIKQEPQSDETPQTGNTETYGGVQVEALPEWNFSIGESIDLDNIDDEEHGEVTGIVEEDTQAHINETAEDEHLENVEGDVRAREGNEDDLVLVDENQNDEEREN